MRARCAIGWSACAATRVSDDGWQRNHPAAVLVELTPRLWRFVRSFWPIMIAAWFGGTPFGGVVTYVAVISGVAVLQAAVGAVVHQATFRWRLIDGTLMIQSGLFDRQVRVLPVDRVQNVETVRSPLHRLMGVVEVRIETASGSEVEGRLTAVDEAVAAELVSRLLAARTGAPPATREEVVVVRNGIVDLVRYGMAMGRPGTVALVFGGLFELTQFRDPDALGGTIATLGQWGTLALVGIALTGAWWAGVVLALVQHHGFHLSTRGDALVAEGGLWVRRRVDLSARRIQSVTARQAWLARWLGFWTIGVETAAAREGGGGVERAEAVVPVVDEPDALLRRLVPDLALDPLSTPYRPSAPRAARRAALAAVLRWGAVALVLNLVVDFRAAWAFVVPVVAALVAWRRVRAAGWNLTEAHILVRGGLLRRFVTMAPRARIQAVHVVQGPWLRRSGLARIDVRLAGSALSMPLLDVADAHALALRLVRAA